MNNCFDIIVGNSQYKHKNHTGVLFRSLSCLPSSAFPRRFLLAIWSPPAVDSHDTNGPDAFWEGQTTMGVQSPTPFHVLPHTNRSLSPELTCHTLATGEVTAATQTLFDRLCLCHWVTLIVTWFPDCRQFGRQEARGFYFLTWYRVEYIRA